MTAKYRPANGMEGQAFMDLWCCRCVHFDGCKILADTMGYMIDDPHYPAEWTFNAHGQPCCTAFAAEEDKPDPNAHLQQAFPEIGT